MQIKKNAAFLSGVLIINNVLRRCSNFSVVDCNAPALHGGAGGGGLNRFGKKLDILINHIAVAVGALREMKRLAKGLGVFARGKRKGKIIGVVRALEPVVVKGEGGHFGGYSHDFTVGVHPI